MGSENPRIRVTELTERPLGMSEVPTIWRVRIFTNEQEILLFVHLCSHCVVRGALGSIVLVLFLIGIFMIPVVISAIVLARRMSRKRNKGEYETQEDRASANVGQKILVQTGMPLSTPVQLASPIAAQKASH
jgi:ABC-type bacteriocin/lantibiotic exporter with double-glycine peptidase domain